MNIAEGRKTLEVRSWSPNHLPLLNLVIVQNDRYLTSDEPEDADGLGVAMVDVLEVHDWLPHEAAAACSTNWQPGYKAWVLTNVRPFSKPMKLPAKRKLYEVEVGDIPTSAP